MDQSFPSIASAQTPVVATHQRIPRRVSSGSFQGDLAMSRGKHTKKCGNMMKKAENMMKHVEQ